MSNTEDSGRTCLELALQGECCCKIGECQKGVEYFEMALQVGTDDLLLLSAIYSQLGNAYFYIQEYEKALRFHKYDLSINSILEYKTGRAKAYGNLGNTLKIMGRFDEAVTCCKHHLSISQESKDRIGEARALYNLGNIFLSKAQKVGHRNYGDLGQYPVFAEVTLNQAIDYYRANLTILTELGDRAAVGRTCGNLGNAYYLLGDFENSTQYHQQRLEIAKEFGDKAAERRAYSNLGNACVFRNEYEMAAEYYRFAYDLARQLGDRAVEGQVCYSLGNLYTLLKDHAKSVEYHLLHLQIAKELNDAVGLGRAYWSLGNAYTEIGNTRKAISFIKRHLDLSTKMGDASSQQTAQQKLKDLNIKFGLQESDSVFNGRSCVDEDEMPNTSNDDSVDVGLTRRYRSQKRNEPSPVVRSTVRPSMEQLVPTEEDDEKFFDMLNHLQGRRLDDQRCSYRILENSLAKQRSSSATTPCLLQNECSSTSDSNAGNQLLSARRSSASVFGGADGSLGSGSNLPGLAGINSSHSNSSRDNSSASGGNVPDDEFLNLLVRTQSLRYEDQRSSLPTTPVTDVFSQEDFFSLIQRLQSSRLNDQRSSIPRSSSMTLQTDTSSTASSSVQSSGTKSKSSKKQK